MKRIQPIIVESIDSTNRALKEMARAGAPEGTLLIADRQSGGYGRLSRPFFSPEKTGLFLHKFWESFPFFLSAHPAQLPQSFHPNRIPFLCREQSPFFYRFLQYRNLPQIVF